MNEEQIRRLLDTHLGALTDEETRKALRKIAEFILLDGRDMFSSAEILEGVCEIFMDLEKK